MAAVIKGKAQKESSKQYTHMEDIYKKSLNAKSHFINAYAIYTVKLKTNH